MYRFVFQSSSVDALTTPYPAFGLSFHQLERYPSNHLDTWRDQRPVSPEGFAGGLVGSRDAGFGAGDRLRGVDRIGAQGPYDLCETGFVKAGKLLGRERAEYGVGVPRTRDSAKDDFAVRSLGEHSPP